MIIVWTKPARRDFREIVLYIAQDNPYAARSLQAQICERIPSCKTTRISAVLAASTVRASW